jgi:hypothetical protein
VPPTATRPITRIQAITTTPTATPLAVAALPVVEQGPAGLAAASAPAAATGGNNLPLWGAAALALVAGATAHALTRRREREAEHEAELDRKREQAAEWAAKATALKAQVEANKRAARPVAAVVAAAAAVVADVARRSADRRVERLEDRLHAQEVQAQERARLEAARQREAEEQRRAEEAERARVAAAAAAAERLRAIAQARDEPAPAVEVPWWQRAWDGVRQAADRAIAWVDQHQVAVAIGIGVVAGAAAVLLTGGVAAPLIVGALAAGGVSALGTVGLNAYFGRPLGTNVLRNAGLSAGAAVLTTAAGLAVRAGLVGRAALAAGNAVTLLCGRNPVACTRAEGVLQAMDTAEQVVLQAQMAFQTATGDPRAAETALELQLEYMDGGLPGNTAIRELGDVGQDALSSVANYGDEAAEVATVLQRHSDDVLDVLDDGVIHVRPDVAEEVGDELAEVLAGRNVRVWRSTTSGAVYASVPARQALDALDELEAIARSGQTSGDDVEQLIETLAAASTRGAGDRAVLGRFGDTGEYIQTALHSQGVFFDTSSEVYERLTGIGIDPWRVNEAFLRQQHIAGRPNQFDLRLAGEGFAAEAEAIHLVGAGDMAGALRAVRSRSGEVPVRLREAQWLLEQGYTYVVDETERVIRWLRP